MKMTTTFLRRSRPSRESGVVLIAVLWGTIVMATLAFALSTLVRTGTEELRARKEGTQAHFLARGAIYKATNIMGITAAKPEDAPFRPGQRELRWSEPGADIRVEVMDESGKLDVNAASEEVLQRLMMNLGENFADARAIVAAIEDWRDPDSDTRLGGAEENYYLSLREPYRPANANFTSIRELLLVRGVTPELFWGRYAIQRDGSVQHTLGLADCLTVNSGSAAVNINYAPMPVLLAIPQITSLEAGYIVEGRQRKPFASISDFTHDYPVLLGGETLSSLSASPSGKYTLIAAATTPSGITSRVSALVQLTGLGSPEVSHRDNNGRLQIERAARQGPPFLILHWDDSYVR